MAARVAAALRAAGASEVACVGPAVGGLPAIVEEEPGSGPLGAVVAALRWADPDPVVVAPCDLVAPAGSVFAALIAALDDGHDVVVAVHEGRANPIIAAYAARAVTHLSTAFARGERSVVGALGGLRVRELDDLDASALRDADRPADLGR